MSDRSDAAAMMAKRLERQAAGESVVVGNILADSPVDLYDPASYGPAEPVTNCPDHEGPCTCTVSTLRPDLEEQFKAWVAERFRHKYPHLRTPDFEGGV